MRILTENNTFEDISRIKALTKANLLVVRQKRMYQLKVHLLKVV